MGKDIVTMADLPGESTLVAMYPANLLHTCEAVQPSKFKICNGAVHWDNLEGGLGLAACVFTNLLYTSVNGSSELINPWDMLDTHVEQADRGYP